MPNDRGAAVNERVAYVSPYRAGTYEAVVRALNPDGTVALDVYLPGAAIGRKNGRELDKPAVRLRAVSYGPEGRARPLNSDASAFLKVG